MQQDRKARETPEPSFTDRSSNSRQNLSMECPAPRQETEELKDALAKEKALCSDQQNIIKELRKQLDETKKELKRQKSLKETFIIKAKETNRDMERLKKHCDPHTLRTANIADPSETTREKKKRVLHNDYEKLQMAYIIRKEKFTAELQAEKEKNQFLQAQLDTSSAIYHDLHKMYQNDANKAREMANVLRCELEKEYQQRMILLKYHEELQEKYRHSQETLTAELQAEREKKILLQQELDSMKVSYREDQLRYEVSNVRQQAGTLQGEPEKETQQKTVLLKEYEELKAAHMHSQETSSAELQEQKEKNKLFQEELKRISVSYLEISQRYETDILAARQQADTLQCQLDREIEAHTESLSQSFNTIKKLKTALCQKVVEETNKMEQEESPYKRELERLKAKLSEQISHNKNLSTELEAERKDDPPPRNMAWPEEKHEDEPGPAPAVDPPKEVEVTEELPNNQQASTSDAPELEHQPPPDLPPRNTARQEENCEDEPGPAPAVDPPKEVEVTEELPNNQQASISDAPELEHQPPPDLPPRNTARQEENCEDEPGPAPAVDPPSEADDPDPESDASDLEHQEEAEISEETPQPKTPSFWKRTRHVLGLRKPQKWKNTN
uniref:hyaluronan-mediated motility receptor-like n=1 Tax=Scatophagus argus TaxID=75038 RepID=UPI001ED7EE03|nr:hyaluronan-mediated motility receptor-like [Scatophagus argus]